MPSLLEDVKEVADLKGGVLRQVCAVQTVLYLHKRSST